MKHGSLFSGIGGFDLASEWMGWQNVFHCEWNPFGQKVLKYYWPNSIQYHDITKTDFTIHRGEIDILTGGFPCQPYSQAGKRLGKEDDRHLWPSMLRAISEIQPSWVVGENVRGLTNWNGGMVFDEVQADLEAIGYEVTPFLLPACAVNAPHRRDRIWFVAYSDSNGQQRSNSQHEINTSEGRVNALNDFEQMCESDVVNSNGFGLWRKSNRIGESNEFSEISKESNASNSECIRLEHSTNTGEISGKKKNSSRQRSKSTLSIEANVYGYKSNWQNFPTVSPICDGDDGLSNRLDSITFPKWRAESIKAGGNAIVPQVALQIFKAIQEYENLKNKP